VSNRVSRRQAGRWAQQDEQQYQQQAAEQQAYQQPPPPPAAPPEDDMDEKIAQVKKLGELKDQGLLTDAEFQTQKSRILGL
jgi:Short C-terminal domain